MIFKGASLFFFSGTGNSYRVSRWVHNIAGLYGLKCKTIFTPNTLKDQGDIISNNEIIGIIFPTHGFTMPWEILKFVCRLPVTKTVRAFCIATRASLKIGSVTIPGMSGNGAFIVSLILAIKGYKLRGIMSVNMPSNWFLVHPIQSIRKQEEILNHSRIKVNSFSIKIFTGKKVWLTHNNLYEIINGILLSFISLGYLLIGRFFHSKLFFANSNCTSCGLCVKNCPFNAIKINDYKKAKPFWTYRCESCMKCASICPHNAIELGQSWGVILYFIAVLPASAYLFSFLSQFVPGVSELKGGWLSFLVDFLFWYPAIFITYIIFHLINRISLVNWIFTNTTMTHIKAWGRYNEPGTNLLTFDK